MSSNPFRTPAAHLARRLHVVALLALLLAQLPPIGAGRASADEPARRQPQPSAAAPIAASMTDTVLVDRNLNGRADPGDTLRYTVVVSNGSGMDLAGVTFDDTLDPNTTLAAGGAPRVSPLALDDSYSTNRDTLLITNAPGLLANDTGTPAPSITPHSGTTAAGGSVSMNADGSFSYTPPPGYTGIDSFSYSATNAAGSDTGTATLAVRAPPLAATDTYTVTKNTTRTVAAPGILANDSGFPPPSVMPFSGATVAGGSVTVAVNGGFSYTPPPGYSGSDSFDYTATNVAGSDIGTVNLVVVVVALAQDDPSYTAPRDAQLHAPQAGLVQNDTRGLPAASSVSANLGTLPAGKQATIIFDAVIADPLPIGVGQVSNQGTVAGSGFASVLTDDPRRPGAADPTATFVGVRRIYIPQIAKFTAPPLPDLVVGSITTSGGSLQVTIRNAGFLAVTDPFWVDVYVDPTTAPERVNQVWSDLGSRGAAWGVLGKALPLAPGATLTLSVGDAYYRSPNSNPGLPIAVGTPIYAQVDSYGPGSSYGAVLESHERDGEPYNNILGPVSASK